MLVKESGAFDEDKIGSHDHGDALILENLEKRMLLQIKELDKESNGIIIFYGEGVMLTCCV